jgi:carboxypeptidase T
MEHIMHNSILKYNYLGVLMFKRNLFFMALIVIFSTSMFASDQVVVRFDNPTSEIVREFNSIDYDVASYKPGEYLDIVIQLEDYDGLVNSGYSVRITQTEEQLKANLNSGTDLAGYIDYEEFLAVMQQAEIDYPDLCKLYDIGDSWGKIYSDAGNTNYDDFQHEIWALKLSDNVEEEEDEPCIYYFAEHHAREPISLEVVMTVLEHVLDNYGTDPTITENIDNQQIWFVPLVNPNGHKVVTDEIETMWRKNIRDNNENSSLNVSGYSPADGADPNRNYGWEWGGASTSWTSETYQGTSAFSEPETQAVRDLMAAHHFVAGLSYHSYSELILYPYGYSDGVVAPDQLALSELCTDMAVTIPGQYSGHYTPQAAWELYSCTGTTDDYAYGTYGIFSYTVELATEFIPPANQVEGICDNNIEAALIMLDRTSHSILKGHITDAGTGETLQAEIFVDGVDDTGVFRNPYMSDMDFGAYYRLLTDGSYDVTFTAYGYESQTIEDVIITDANPTIVDIAMTNCTANASISGIVTDAETGSPIQNATIELLGYGIPAVTTNAQGEYSISEIYAYNYDLVVYADGYAAHQELVEITDENIEIDFSIYVLDDGTFENGTLGGCWTFGGQNEWELDFTNVYEGVFSIRSGSIGHNQQSEIEVSMFVSDDNMISFYRKVSSEGDYDYLKFHIDGEVQEQWSGNMDWAEASYPVTAGFHTFRWSYVKDGGVASGSDCGWIDNIVLPQSMFFESPSNLTHYIAYPQTAPWEVNLFWDAPGNTEFLGYNLYKDDTMLNSELITDATYSDYVDYGSTMEYYVTSVYDGGESSPSNIILIDEDDWPLSNDNNVITFETAFYGNHPNPFNPSTTFKFSLSNNSKVVLNIYNVKGQMVKSLLNKELDSGVHTIVWNGEDENGKIASSGVYFSTFDAENSGLDFTSVKKIILLK